MPEPASTWLGLTIPEFGYFCCQTIFGLSFLFAFSLYMRLLETM